MTPEQLVLRAWKQQLDIGFRMIETILEGATKLREAQLEAACEAHADAVATQKAVEQATSAAELLRLQAQWAAANLESSIAYWHAVHEAMSDTNADLANCLQRKAA